MQLQISKTPQETIHPFPANQWGKGLDKGEDGSMCNESGWCRVLAASQNWEQRSLTREGGVKESPEKFGNTYSPRPAKKKELTLLVLMVLLALWLFCILPCSLHSHVDPPDTHTQLTDGLKLGPQTNLAWCLTGVCRHGVGTLGNNLNPSRAQGIAGLSPWLDKGK